MLLNVRLIANLRSIQARRQLMVDKNARKANLKRLDHDYKVGEKVLVKSGLRNAKLDYKYKGPFVILQVHTNGNVSTLLRKANVSERVKIRRLKSYKGNTATTQRPRDLNYFN